MALKKNKSIVEDSQSPNASSTYNPSPLCNVKVSNFGSNKKFCLQPEKIQNSDSDDSDRSVEPIKKFQSVILTKSNKEDFIGLKPE